MAKGTRRRRSRSKRAKATSAAKSELNTPHDALFRKMFADPVETASLLRGALPQSLASRFDWSTLRLEEGRHFSPKLKGRATDVLFTAELEGVSAYIYVLLEHQSTSDRWMALRLFEYTGLTWRRLVNMDNKKGQPALSKLPVVIPLVVHHSATGWSAPRSLRELIEPAHMALEGVRAFVPDFSFLLLDLVNKTDAELAREIDSDRSQLVLAWLKHASYEDAHAGWADGWVSVIARVVHTEGGLPFLEILVEYLLEVSEIPLERVRDVLRSAMQDPEVERVMSTAEKLRQEGLQEGIAKARALLLRQIELRFDSVPPELGDRVGAASMSELEAWAERILTAETIDDLFL